MESAVQQIMTGSDMVWICTETMLRGFAWLPKMLDALEKYMAEMGYNRIRDFRDILLGNIVSAQDLTLHEGYAEVNIAKCTTCGLCLKIGHCHAIYRFGDIGTAVIENDECLGCSTCVDVCPSHAISMKKA